MVKINEISVICPIHFLSWNYFPSNLQSWFDELPIKTLYLGCNNKDKEFYESLKDYLSGNDKIEFIDQRNIKTLGMQITDLMKRIEDTYFVYVHADAFLTKHCFLIMEAEMEDNVGIVESEHINYNEKEWILPKYWLNPRSFSGFQLFRKKAIENILKVIEDDYIYRNEDIIFQNACEVAGYEFRKVWAVHLHYITVNSRWTPQGVECENTKAITYDMQSKGIVKYCKPISDITKKAWRDGFGGCIRYNNANIFDFIENFVKKVNIEWEKPIKKIISELLIGVYK